MERIPLSSKHDIDKVTGAAQHSPSASSPDDHAPAPATSPTGQQVLQILSKRPSDLTSEELQVMRELSRGRTLGDAEIIANLRAGELVGVSGRCH